ncbi:acyltransferase [Paenibacillus sp. MY03]|uniref:DapH/DapD/GlmU-related protein n=1 Tax=Paenibacillus sp. MY03 TaxID=302980 RepID=UPI000B3C7299|nr:DapH/DapD/GlmU-related protein [Paenibacillus sp. MY03]OUS69950.1 acyltransferase [Paenibacillus sp. MY03]
MKSLYKISKKIFIVASKLLLSLIYKKKYLQGKWFDNSAMGWKWAWEGLFLQKILGYNRHIPWPVSAFNTLYDPKNIEFHPDDINNFQGKGKYFQNFNAKIVIGKGTFIGPNVGIITSNHDSKNLSSHVKGNGVYIGKNCWIGMNAIILPDVVIGDNTIVGAGSVVTKSFIDGNCVIGGNPARIIKLSERGGR